MVFQFDFNRRLAAVVYSASRLRASGMAIHAETPFRLHPLGPDTDDRMVPECND